MPSSASETAAIRLVTLSRSLKVGTIIDSSAAGATVGPTREEKRRAAGNGRRGGDVSVLGDLFKAHIVALRGELSLAPYVGDIS